MIFDRFFNNITEFCSNLIGAIGVILFTLFLGVCIVAGCAWVYGEYKWDKSPAIECSATLISRDHYPSTRKQTTGTVYIDGKVGVTHHTTGCLEKKVTVWDAGKYGMLESDDERVWRLAKEKSILKIKELDGGVRIVGIKD